MSAVWWAGGFVCLGRRMWRQSVVHVGRKVDVVHIHVRVHLRCATVEMTCRGSWVTPALFSICVFVVGGRTLGLRIQGQQLVFLFRVQMDHPASSVNVGRRVLDGRSSFIFTGTG